MKQQQQQQVLINKLTQLTSSALYYYQKTESNNLYDRTIAKARLIISYSYDLDILNDSQSFTLNLAVKYLVRNKIKFIEFFLQEKINYISDEVIKETLVFMLENAELCEEIYESVRKPLREIYFSNK